MKKPGDQLVSEPTELRLVHHQDKNEMLPYERLLGEAMEGDTSMFAREDSVDAAWAIVEPILGDVTPVHEYAAGKLGPGRRRSPDRGGGRLARDDQMSAPPGVVAAAEAAVALIDDGARVGLGIGARGGGVRRAPRRARARAGLSVDMRRDVGGGGTAGAGGGSAAHRARRGDVSWTSPSTARTRWRRT